MIPSGRRRRLLARLLTFATLVFVQAAPLRARAGDDEASCERPKITLLHYDEDYSFLRNPRCRRDFWDPIKYVALDARAPTYLTLGLDLRERYELFDNLDWGRQESGAPGHVLQRVMPYADLHLDPHVRGFVQLTSNVVFGRDPRPLDRDDLDVLQGFGAVSFGSSTLRIGRQEIQYADSRLVSIREGPNVRLAFDGARLMQRIGAWQVDALAVAPVNVQPGVFDDPATPGQRFWGAYATGPVLSKRLGLDAYYLGLFRRSAAFEQGAADELRHTFGTRVWGESAGADYDVELTYQAGTFGAGTIGAWMVASDVGYSIDPLPARPRVGVKVNATSGDASARSADLQTFNPLFPRGAYFSQANLIGPLNLVDVHPTLTLRATQELSIALDWDFFWRQSLADGLYLPSAALQIAGAGNPERYIGSQAQALVQLQATRHAVLAAVYSHLFGGPFFRHAQLDGDVNFVGAWMSYAL